jgi:hypothetical protein
MSAVEYSTRDPELRVDARRRHLAADRHYLGEPVRVADDEAGPGVEVGLGINAERPGRGVDDRHLGQGVHHHHADPDAESV